MSCTGVDGLADHLPPLFFPLHDLQMDLSIQSRPFILATGRQFVKINVDNRLTLTCSIVGLRKRLQLSSSLLS